jgi:hypothetical protein
MVGLLLASELVLLLGRQTTGRRADTSEGNRGAGMIRTGYFSVLMPVVGLLAASLSLKGDA